MAAPMAFKTSTGVREKLPRSASYLNFQDAIRTKLGRKTCRFSMDIFLDIAVVLIGLKPGFLFDYTHVDDPSVLVELCELVIGKLTDDVSSHSTQLSSNLALSDTFTDMKGNYRICQVAGNVFVLNVEKTVDYLTLIYSEDFDRGGSKRVIDVSHSLPKPEFANEQTLPKLKGMLDTVLKQLINEKDFDSQVIKLQLKKDWNVTSLFGFLLGYPVVYWYESPEGQNGLSMVPLTVYKVYSVQDKELLMEDKKTCDENKHVVFSFSLPTEIKQKCQQLIEDWFTDFNETWRNCKLCNIFGNFELKETEIALPSVAL